MLEQARDHFVAEFERRRPGLPGKGTPWIERMRSMALQHFAERGLPTPREEEWKYTNVEALARHRFTAPASAPCAEVLEWAAILAGEQQAFEHLFVFLDGRFLPNLSRLGALPRGAMVASLSELLERDPSRAERYLANPKPATAFAALNAAFAAEGVFIHLPRACMIASPVVFLYLNSAAGTVTHPLNIVLAEEGSTAVLVEHYRGRADTSYFTNAVTRVFMGANARIDHYRLQQEDLSAFHTAAIDVYQRRDSSFASHAISLGGALARTDICVQFEASGCECTLNGLYVAGDNQLLDHHTRIDHLCPHGTSREHYRGILDGHARGVFAGRIVVHPGSQKTDARLVNHNLLLSPRAEVDTKPQLEIYADDVKCTHGTTVGRLDEDALFYLRSRGISAELAEALLTHAFAHEVTVSIRLAALKTRVEDILMQRLPGSGSIRALT